MKRIVKVVVRDYPKRSNSMRTEIEVEARDDSEALANAVTEGQIKWPGGKITAYDLVPAPKRPVLKAKSAA